MYVIADLKLQEGRTLHEMLKYHPAPELSAHQIQVDLLASIILTSDVIFCYVIHLDIFS